MGLGSYQVVRYRLSQLQSVRVFPYYMAALRPGSIFMGLVCCGGYNQWCRAVKFTRERAREVDEN